MENFENQNQIQNQNQNLTLVQSTPLDFGVEISKMLHTAGTLILTDKQNDILYAPVNDFDVFIKPDGLIYLSWMKYSERLNKALGGTSWTMLPEGTPKIMNTNLVVWGFHLVIKGSYQGFSLGEQQYFSNSRMTYGEACEGAKSNALMRLCKGIGIGLELWDKNFIDRWVKTYARSYQGNDGKTKWTLKDGVQDNFLKLQAQEKEGKKTSTLVPVVPVIHASEVIVSVVPKTKKSKKVVQDENIPLEEITELEVAGIEKQTIDYSEEMQQYIIQIESCTIAGQVRGVFDIIKSDLKKGLITEENKETLREMANKKFVTLQSK
ncbi:MAG: hypothetical protein EXR20_02400 [Bacteroidetes bacterium]|nr:hypothetical protein [Bacteroidota bacterium]